LFDDAFDAPGRLNNCELEFLAAGKCLNRNFQNLRISRILAVGNCLNQNFSHVNDFSKVFKRAAPFSGFEN
jgi:hypothetical protein